MSNTNTNLQTQTLSVLHNDTVSLCSISKVQEKTQLSRSRCMNSLREVKSQFKFLSKPLQDFGTMPIFKRTFSQDLDLLEQHLTKDILSQTDCNTTLTKLRTKFENAFNSEFKERMQKYTRFNAQSFQDAMICNMDSIGKYMLDLVVIQNTCSEKEDSNSETASSKSVKESSLNYETKDVHAIKYKMSKAKERCVAYFRSLHSHLQVLSKEDLKGTRIEHGFKRAFMSLFGQDVDTFTSTMLLNVDKLQKQLDKDEFQEYGSMAAFWVVNNQFQKFIDSQFTLDYDSQMTDKYFIEYTRIEMQTQESKIDTGKAVDDALVVTESSGTESEVQDDSGRPGNDTDADDADIRLIYDEEPMAEVQLTAKCNIFAIGQQHIEQLEIINEGRVDQFQSTADGSKPKPRSTNHSTRSLPVSKSSWVTITAVPKANHSKSSSSFPDSKHFVCSTCHKCVFNANHDACITKLLKEVNSHAKIQSYKTGNSNKLVDQKSHTQKPGRQIFTRQRFSPNKTFIMYEKTSPRSDLRWKPMGRIFKFFGLRWIPTGKLFNSCTSKDNSEPTHGSNVDIPNIHESKQTLYLSACTSINVQKEQSLDLSV
ncbi:hypothetical protein Tco_0767123, partial [Tanacetum coccineum]